MLCSLYIWKIHFLPCKIIIRTQIDHTYQVGDYDKSYLYAKELINAGMSVIYENITSTTELKNIAIINNIPNASEKNLVNMVEVGKLSVKMKTSFNIRIFKF